MLSNIILGHVIGDYILQPRIMANKKGSQSVEGYLWCFLHCMIYTMSVCCVLKDTTPLTLFIIFNSHFWIDKFSMAKYWMIILNGKDYVKLFSKTPDNHIDLLEMIFGSFVYIVIDNSFHILLMWWLLT